METRTERDIDQELVIRAQQGDKAKPLNCWWSSTSACRRLLSRLIRDPAEIEDVAQEGLIKAYRALPSFRCESAFYLALPDRA